MAAQKKPYTSGALWSYTVAGTVAFFSVWYFARWLALTPPTFLPLPHEVVTRWLELWKTPFAGYVLWDHLMSSLWRYTLGFLLAAGIGVSLGLLMGRIHLLDRIVSPIFDSLRFIAPVAWVPFAALWFGTGIGGPILIIFAGAFPPCLINAYRGARAVEPRYIEAAQMLGVGQKAMLTEVIFPAAIPSIIAGLRIGAGLGWMSLVGAELIAANSGMGYLIVKGQSAVATDIVMAGMITIGAVGVFIDIALRKIEARLLGYRQSV
jgi:ABC-type nitrate/sulfonate/bicarbonate transport system permease component